MGLLACQYEIDSESFFYPLYLGEEVNFRLTYDGPLKAANQSNLRREDKHRIRRAFHRQLYELLTIRNGEFLTEEIKNSMRDNPEGSLTVQRGDFNCFALVREKLNLVCDLDILFLRRDEPGRMFGQGGDLDNRIKVLFDALRMPKDDNEVMGLSPDKNVGMLVCLTEDDSLITGFRVTTDRLLEPPTLPHEKNFVRLIINVEIKATKLTSENMAYFAHF